MPLFGEKQKCPHCGKTVHRSKSSEDFFCGHCGRPGPWATEDQRKDWEAAEAGRRQEEARRAEARARYQELLAAFAAGAPELPSASVMQETAAEGGYTPTELGAMNHEAFIRLVDLATSDDILTPEEDATLTTAVERLGVSWEWLNQAHRPLVDRIMISSANSGRLPALDSTGLMTKPGEIVHMEVHARLMKEVVVREYRGGYQGFSIPVGKSGVRYRVGGARGRMVTVGTHLEVADQGALAISSRRAVFMGAKKTMEMLYSKLVNLQVFTDGLQFHLSNRQTAPLSS